MNWASQMRHFVANDVRHRPWMLVLYIVLVLIASVAATVPQYNGAPMSAWPLLIAFFGMVTIASIVQADSPARADAFWVSKPIRPSAMASAKLVAAIALLAIGVAGQWFALAAQDVPPHVLTMILLSSTESYGVLLLIAMLLSSLTGDLRSFILSVLCGVVTLVILAGVGTAITWMPFAPLLHVLGPAAALWFVWVAYHTRDNRWRVRLAGAGAIVCLWLSRLAASAPPGSDATLPASVARTPLTVAFPRSDEAPPGEAEPLSSRLELSLMISMPDAPATERRIVTDRRASVILMNGARKALNFGDGVGVMSRGDSITTLFPVRWLNFVPSTHSGSRTQISAPLNKELRDALRAGAKSIELEGKVEVWRGSGSVTVPLREGSVLAHDGTRVRIGEVSTSASAIHVIVAVNEIVEASENSLSRLGFDAPRFAIVNEERREAIALGSSGGGGGGLGLVLPGATITQWNYQLTWQRSPQAPALDAAWIAGAQLMLIEWTRLGSYPATTEIVPH
ncbi:MAG: hypothetical protein ABIT20_03990 [Gemmatimonadaceae bacterium]